MPLIGSSLRSFQASNYTLHVFTVEKEADSMLGGWVCARYTSKALFSNKGCSSRDAFALVHTISKRTSFGTCWLISVI